MKYKAILFVRVSTVKQDYDRQINDLLPLAEKDGYNKEEIAIIRHKESAIKNNIRQRQSINELKSLIENNTIKHVYVTEISRLARRNDVLYGVQSILAENKIALVCQTPTEIRTYKEVNGEWKKDGIADMIISFLGYAAEMEGNYIKERVKSGYAQKKADGKLVASKVIYGYRRTKDNYPQIDEKSAKVVRDVYKMYVEDKVSCATIAQKYEHTDMLSGKTVRAKANYIARLLGNRTYIGENTEIQYPRIISDELFSKAQERLKSNTTVKSNLSNIYYLQGIIKLSYNDKLYAMTPNITQACYRYYSADDKKAYSVNMNVVESIAWYSAIEARAIMESEESEAEKQKANEEILLINDNLCGIEGLLKDKEEESDRTNKLFIKGKLKEDDYDSAMELIESEIATLTNRKEELMVRKAELIAIISDESDRTLNSIVTVNNMEDITDEKLRAEIVKGAIKEVLVKSTCKGAYEIRVKYNSERAQLYEGELYYRNEQRGCKNVIFKVYEDGTCEDVSASVIKRHRRKGKK